MKNSHGTKSHNAAHFSFFVFGKFFQMEAGTNKSTDEVIASKFDASKDLYRAKISIEYLL